MLSRYAEVAGERRLFLAQLTRRFGPLPVWAEEKLAGASCDMLEHWGLQLLDARRLEEVFQ